MWWKCYFLLIPFSLTLALAYSLSPLISLFVRFVHINRHFTWPCNHLYVYEISSDSNVVLFCSFCCCFFSHSELFLLFELHRHHFPFTINSHKCPTIKINDNMWLLHKLVCVCILEAYTNLPMNLFNKINLKLGLCIECEGQLFFSDSLTD